MKNYWSTELQFIGIFALFALLIAIIVLLTGCATNPTGLKTGNIGLNTNIPVTIGNVKVNMPTYVPIVMVIIIIIGFVARGLLKKSGQAVKYLGDSLLLLINRIHR